MEKLFYLFIALYSTNYVSAQTLNNETIGSMHLQSDALGRSAGFDTSTNNATISLVIANIIKTFLGFLGIIFIVLIIWAGYNWMTASGNEEKVTKAKKSLYQAVIGLLITLSAYAITYFVFTALDSATTSI